MPDTNLDSRPHALAQSIDERTSTVGLRAVAAFEALKGSVVLLLGFVFIAIHHHAEDLVSSLLFHLHFDPDRGFARMLMNAATRLNDARLLTILLAAVTYAVVRFVEAWGLWNRRVWAEWFALLSGAMYLPWELLKLSERADWERASIFAGNILIVLYMLLIRVQACRPFTNCEKPPSSATARR
jgi:uncharacterized membrane protein (DUF2068 family)